MCQCWMWFVVMLIQLKYHYYILLSLLLSLSLTIYINTKVHKSLERIRERRLAPFITWGPASVQVPSFIITFSLLTIPRHCSGGIDQIIALHSTHTSRLWSHVGQSHVHSICIYCHFSFLFFILHFNPFF